MEWLTKAHREISFLVEISEFIREKGVIIDTPGARILPDSIIVQLQQHALDETYSVAALLRKALVVAAKLDLTDAEKWIELELSGWAGSSEEIPEWRTIYGDLVARNLYHSWIPAYLPDQGLMNTINKVCFAESVAEIESISRAGDLLMRSIPFEGQKMLAQAFAHEAEYAIRFTRAQVVGVLGSIRDRVLFWSLELEKRGIIGNGLSFSVDEKEKAQTVHVNVYGGSANIGQIGTIGDGAMIAVGDGASAGPIDAGKLQQLINQVDAHADQLGLPEPELTELRAILTDLRVEASKTAPDPSRARKLVKGVFGFVGKTTDSVIQAGVKACVEVWLKAHGGL